MKILLIGPANSIHLQRLAEALSARGNSVVVATQHPAPVPLLDVEVFELPMRGGIGYLGNAFPLKSFIKEFQPDVINVHYASGYGTLASLACPGRYILSFWGDDVYDFPKASKLHWLVLKRTTDNALALASTSQAMITEINQVLKPHQKVAFTPFGIDTQVFSPGSVEKSETPFVVGTVRGLEPVYGIDLLIKSFARLVEIALRQKVISNKDEMRLDIVGDGPQKQELQALTESLAVADRVRFLGKVDNDHVPEYLHNMHLFAALSRRESFGVAVIEAMACGLPVIVSDVGGLPELVANGKEGFVIKNNDSESFVAHTMELLKNRSKVGQMGISGRERVLANFSIEETIKNFEALYSENIQS